MRFAVKKTVTYGREHQDMPRRGENIYKRKDGRWEGRALEPGGRYRYVYAKTYKEVREKKKSLQERLRIRTESGVKDARCASERFSAWLSGGLSERVKPSTYESYHRCITKYVVPFFQEKGHEQITEKTAAEFAGAITHSPNLSASYQRKILSIFKTALRQLLKDSGESESLLRAVSLPRAESADVQAFSVREQRMIEKTVRESADRAAFGILLCFYTGIRLGEVCALKWGDIDFEAGALSVTRTVSRIKNFRDAGSKTILEVGAPKSLKSIRKIPLPHFLAEMSAERKMDASDQDRYVLSGTGVPIDPRSYQKQFQRILRKAGVKSRKFHAIRHTFATRALELGVDIKTLSEILGHADVSITLNVYAHSMFEQKQKAIARLNAMYLTHTQTASFAVAGSVVNA